MVATSMAAQRDLRPLLAMVPDHAVAVVAAADPAAAVGTLTALLEPMPAGVPAELVARLGVGLTALRVAFDGPTGAWVHRLAGGGVVVALVPPEPGAGWQWLAVTRPPDVAAADAWCARHADRLHRSVVGEHLLLAATAAGVDRLRAGADRGTWATTGLALPAPTAADINAEVDLAAVRRWLGPRAPSLDPLGGVARFVFAPIVHALATAPRLRLSVQAADARLRVAVHADASMLAAPFGALLANGDRAVAVPVLPPGGLLALTLDRSLQALLADPARFLSPDDVQAVQGFLSIADALDGPRSAFVADLLGGLREPLTLQVLPPAASDGEGARVPITLPEFGVVAEFATDAAVDGLFRAARLLATIVNAERAQRGEAPFLVRRLHDDAGNGLVAEPPLWRGPGAAPFDRQLSPTLWVGNGRIALASTQRAAQAMVAGTQGPAVSTAGDLLVLHGPAIGAAIARSRSALAFGRMLDEGEDRAEAEQFLAIVIAFAEAVAELRLGVALQAETTRLVLELERRR